MHVQKILIHACTKNKNTQDTSAVQLTSMSAKNFAIVVSISIQVCLVFVHLCVCVYVWSNFMQMGERLESLYFVCIK